MRSLNDTLTRLSALRSMSPGATSIASQDRLTGLAAFGSNPGALRARFYVPEPRRASAPLVVVLHGCTQDAAGYDRGSGWSQLADEQGFALLYPEQQRANNANLCFNWFNSTDTQRNSGEALSIRQMVSAMVTAHGLDPTRVYVTCLSAGGAMASVMLATYPDVFAGGAIIAGLPYGTATSVPEAFDRMQAHGGPPAAALGELVAAASNHRGQWPTISVWHGDNDSTVSAANAALIVEQWRALHGVAAQPTAIEDVDGHPRHIWHDGNGREVIEEYRILGLGHGTPLSTSGSAACGTVGPYMLEAGISSTRQIARFWGLMPTQGKARTKPAAAAELRAPPAPATSAVPTIKRSRVQPLRQPVTGDVGRVIDALRAAGLMR
ncbi:PHB depolymerase family esterase [Sphingomonas sp. MAH-20]|uniref:PHB depolymerase family esterase n=1 Tax=Sphingomonas horti TaxID=2682842 RepID=A0A6I4J4L2_9SPHN|nr:MULTISPECIES: PHB depolymerase family esterase [Sphingomonas]MBA2920570.1 PHB depolymerase family esterase [Sphingomonas sp. CGMCC 1.13658]MVO78161.1 PHB depolymerase family esterase [Sphingomonas horti]